MSSSAHDRWHHWLPQHRFPCSLALFTVRGNENNECYKVLNSPPGRWEWHRRMHHSGRKYLLGSITLPSTKKDAEGDQLRLQHPTSPSLGNRPGAAAHRQGTTRRKIFPWENARWAFSLPFMAISPEDTGQGEGWLSEVRWAGAAPVFASLYPRSWFWNLCTVLLTRCGDN